MVIYRSEPSRSRTSIHGGLRRGAAAAALGAILVFSAGVPASQAADGKNDAGKPAQAKGPKNESVIGGVLKDLQGGSAGRSNAHTAPSEPTPASPSPAPTGPAPTGTASAGPARPSDQATPSPSPTPVAPAPDSPTSPAAVPRDVRTPGAPSQGAAASPSPSSSSENSRNGSAVESDAGTPVQPAAPGTPQPGSEGRGSRQSDATQPDATQGAAPTTTQTTAVAHGSGSTESAGYPTAAVTPSARHEMTAAGPAAETTKVWLGVGLVGSAGAAGLLFARIRKF